MKLEYEVRVPRIKHPLARARDEGVRFHSPSHNLAGARINIGVDAGHGDVGQ